ncbi:hypothetical protein KSS87_021045, partial [Heliosperma pusillum]
MAIPQTFIQQCQSISALPHFSPFPTSTFSSSSSSFNSSRFSLQFRVFSCSQTSSPMSVVNGNADLRVPLRSEIRFGLPSKGRMAADTLDLLKDCQLSVRQSNPRQYVAQIPQLTNLEVWFQRPTDVVKKLLSGDLDLGIVGFDILSEYGQVAVTTLTISSICLSFLHLLVLSLFH